MPRFNRTPVSDTVPSACRGDKTLRRCQAPGLVLEVVELGARGVGCAFGRVLRVPERVLSLALGFLVLVAGQLALCFLDLAFDAIVHFDPFLTCFPSPAHRRRGRSRLRRRSLPQQAPRRSRRRRPDPPPRESSL